MAAIVERAFDLEALHLEAGVHGEGQGFSLLEAVAYVAGESWTDAPSCVCPAIAIFGRSWNNVADDQGRQDLKAYVSRIAHTQVAPENERRRLWMMVDWCCRVLAPGVLWRVGEYGVANAMEGAAAIEGPAAARAAKVSLGRAHKASGGPCLGGQEVLDVPWWLLYEAIAWVPERAVTAEDLDLLEGAVTWLGNWDGPALWRFRERRPSPVCSVLQQSALDLLDRMVAVGAE